jgi:hypothetical protein
MFGFLQKKEKINKDFHRKLLYGSPIDPEYEVTSSLTPGNQRRIGADDKDFIFYQNFKDFDRSINQWHQETPFRLQERGTTLTRLAEDSPQYGRSYLIFYNQIEIGRLEIADSSYVESDMCIFYIEVYGNIAKFLPYNDLLGFFKSLGNLLVSPIEPEQTKFILKLTHAMNASLWQLDEDEEINRSDIEIRHSSVPYYPQYRAQMKGQSEF